MKSINLKIIILALSLIALKDATASMTVAELLKQSNRGGNVKTGTKNSTALPQAQFPSDGTGKKNLSKVKPPRTESFMEDSNDDKAKLEKLLDRQIQELYDLTKKYKDSNQRGDLWLRLAELYVEKASLIDFRKQSDYDQKLKQFQAGTVKVKPKLDLRDAQEFNRKAIQLYQWFVNDFPKDPRMDQALFFLGYNHYEIGDVKKGTSYYDRLVRSYPESNFVTESHFALAEYYFEREEWKTAAKHYVHVTEKKRHRLYAFSLYKYAWSLFRSGQSRKAVTAMEQLIRNAREVNAQAAEGRKISRVRLETEALRDLALFYSEVGKADQAIPYFERLANNDAPKYLERVAFYYMDGGQRESARKLFTFLIERDPKAAKAFDYKYQIVKMLMTAPKTREFREELYSWVRDYGKDSTWASANANNKELIDNSQKLREVTLRSWIIQQHQSAQASRAKFSQTLASEGYRLYFKDFSEGPVAPDMHFFYGELLYDMEKYDEAGIQYRWVVDNAPQSKYGSKAGENIVLAFEKDLPKAAALDKKAGSSVEPLPLSQKVINFVDAGKWYQAKYPNSEKALEISFKTGRVFYQHNHFEEAIPIFKDIVEKHPKSKYADYSANLILDIFNLRKDYAGLEKSAGDLLTLPQFSNTSAGSEIKEILQKAGFKKAQDLESQGDHRKSAKAYEDFAQQNSRSELAVTAHYNAAVNFEKAGMVMDAQRNYLAVIKAPEKRAHKKSSKKEQAADETMIKKEEDLKRKSRRFLAKLQQDVGNLSEAAELYKQSAREAESDNLALNLHYNAALLFDVTGKKSEAINEYEMYARKGRSKDRFDALLSIARIHEKERDYQGAISKYIEFINSSPVRGEKSVEAAFQCYKLAKQTEIKATQDRCRRWVKNFYQELPAKKRVETATYIARVRLDESRQIQSEMSAIKIPSDPKKQARVLQEKLAMLTRLNQQLAEVIKYDSAEEIVDSLSLLGDANFEVGDSVLKTPPPKGLNDEELDQYKQGIHKIADPFLKKAKESWRSAVEKSHELEVYPHGLKTAQENLSKFDPEYQGDFGEISQETRGVVWIQ